MVSKRSQSGRASESAPADVRTGLIALLKRPAVWLLGITGAVATAYVTTTLTDLTKPLPGYVSQLACSLRGSKAAADEPKFTILVSRLYQDDADGSQTRRVLEAFDGERGFRPVLLCDTLKFEFRAGEDLQKAEDATINRGQHLIVEHGADLLIFGEVLLANNAIRVFAINEHGGCDTRPKPVVLQNGLLPDEFDRDTKMKLIGVTLREIASACDSEEYVDWDLFEKRIQKMGAFIERSADGLSPEQYTEAASCSEQRSFAKSTRCLIPATHFVEFTTPADPKQKRKDKWRFTLARAEWFCIAGIIRPDAIDQAPCFTMLTTAPGPDVAPYHDRQVVVLRPPDWAAWLDLSRSEADLLRPLEPGAIAVTQQLPESPTSS